MLPLLLMAACGVATAAGPPKTFRKPIESCPSVGYYFEQRDLRNGSYCYLCYCNNDGYAVCTLRNKERCENNDSSVATSDMRTSVEAELKETVQSRRSRRGLMDLFFDNNSKKDVTLTSISKANEEECKPKSSKSIGCPPTDWCKGCLVCDCDDNGEWQCHVMSFCEDKTPRPKLRKSKKLETTEIDNEYVDAKKIIKTDNEYINNAQKKKPAKTSVRQKKNDKRSVKPKKNDSVSEPKNKKNTKRNKIKSETKPSTTSTTTTPKPKIAVKTLRKFIRKSDMKNGTVPLIVTKKYISTLTPIDSPELLKYKNDSSKLAQILYQQYQATSMSPNASHAVKREIKPEKILHNKQRKHFELKYNARGRKPMNTKEHYDWNEKMKTRKTEHENLLNQTISLHSKNNEVLNPDENWTEQTEHDENKQDTGSHRRNSKVILMPRKRRNKRNVETLVGAPYSTVVENKTDNISLISNQVETLFNTNNETISGINNYKYTVDNLVTKKYDNETTNSGIIYESTSKYVDIITNDNHSSDIENITATGTPGYTDIKVETITQPFTYDVQSLDLKNYTTDKMFTQVNQLQLKNNQSLRTNTSIDYKSGFSTDNEFKIKGAIDTETTTVIENNLVIKNTKKKNYSDTNMTPRVIKKLYISDIDTIITQLNKYTHEKLKKNNVTNKLIANVFTIKPNYSMNITRKSNTSDLEKLLQSLSNKKEKKYSRKNPLSAVKYLKKVYSQLLSTKNNKSHLNNIAVMESICDTFGPCKISSNKIEVLNSKIADLISETKKALDVIRIIRGTLQLLDGESNSTDKKTNEEVEFKRYVKKLNAVLTDTYKTPLTEIQMTQMNSIKNNTKIFINSIGKFAYILNDILEIIHSERAKHENLRKRKIIIKKVVNRHKVNDPLHKIKNLFVKFNILQNSFMRNMYKAISDLEMRNEQNATVDDKSYKHTRHQSSLNKYMHKINYNLEKLKVLALTMGAKERVKRNAMDHDDAVEYLLTLMEYLLKHNNPLQSPQVADGIDLLIDAIRRAPDVKPLKKQVNQSALMPKFPATFKIQSKSKSSSESEDDNLNNQSDNFKDKVSFIKTDLNEKLQTVNSGNDDMYDYRKTTSDLSPKMATLTTSTTTKYVDVEDLVFNGDVMTKVYMATIPPYENIDDPFSFTEKEKEEANMTKIKSNESASDVEDESSILTNKTNVTSLEKTEKNLIISSTEKTIFLTQFDRINEEYEKQIKGNAPSLKSVKIKSRKKTKRLRKKTKLDTNTNVSSVTKEVDKEKKEQKKKIRKKLIKEETIKRKPISTSTEYDSFQIDDDSASRDLSNLDGNSNYVFPSYFN